MMSDGVLSFQIYWRDCGHSIWNWQDVHAAAVRQGEELHRLLGEAAVALTSAPTALHE